MELARSSLDEESGGIVQLCSVPNLFQRLSTSVLTHSSLRQSSIIDYCFHRPKKQPFLHDRLRVRQLSKKLAHFCWDVVLLRKWEWMGSDSGGGLWQWLSLSLTLHHYGKPECAHRLATAVSWLLSKDCGLTEAENILRFFFLLSTPNSRDTVMDTPQTKDGHVYSYYPDSMFELPLDHKGSAMISNVSMAMQLFSSQPGSGFTGFMNQEPSGDDRLFGALSHSTSTDLEDILGLPLLPSDNSTLSLLPKLPRVLPVTSSPLPVPAPPCDCTPNTVALLAEAAASVDTTLLRSWEGWDASLSFLCDATPPTLTHASLILTSKYAELAGVTSSASLLSPPDSLLSPSHTLTSAVDHLPNPLLQPVMGTDRVLFAVSHGLNSLLVSCRAALYSDRTSTLVQVEQDTHHIQPVTRFILELVQNQPLEKFAVMDSLFHQCTQLQGGPHYFLFLSLLSLALLNYLRLVESWVFHGILDTDQWIGITNDVAALDHRDDTYWTRGYSSPDSCAPGFFSHLSHPILTCGKALNLLHLCQPGHPLCSGQFTWPHLKVAYSREQLVALEEQCEAYRSKVEICSQEMAEKEKLARMAREEREQMVVIKARQEARRNEERLREQERADLEAEVIRKHSLAMEQKQAIQRVQALRSEQQEEERRVDKELLQQQKEFALSFEPVLGQETRQDMERHYQHLSEQADLRRARAEWRVARLKLSTARELFWREDTEKWEREATLHQNDIQERKREPQLQYDQFRISLQPSETMYNRTSQDLPSSVNQPAPAYSPTFQDDPSSVNQPAPTYHPIPQDHPSSVDQPAPTYHPTPQDHPSSVNQPSTNSEHANLQELDDKQDIRQPVSILSPNMTPSPTLQDSVLHSGTSHHTTSRGHAPPSTVQNCLQQDDKAVGYTTSRGHAPPSTVQDCLQQDDKAVGYTTSRGHAPPSTVQDCLQQDDKAVGYTTSRGHAPPSTVQDCLQQDDKAVGYTTSRGHAPPSTVQDCLQQDDKAVGYTTSRGHAPPSTVQDLLYCGDILPYVKDYYHTKPHTPPDTIQRLLYAECDPEVLSSPTSDLASPAIVIPQSSGFNLHQDLCVLESHTLHDVLGRILAVSQSDKQVELDFLSLFPLPSLLARSIELPLFTQCSLVNNALLDFLFTHCQLHQHFLSLKKFLLLEDGEFGHSLSTRLCQQLSFGEDWRPLCSPSFLNPLLISAVESSLNHDSAFASRLSFSLKYLPHTVHTNAVKALDFLELKYKVEWPCNIVITAASLHKYNKVLQFLLEMKRSSWVLKQTFHQLKNCSMDELQVRQLQIYRHEFQHFINIMHGYIASQLLGLTWEEFKTHLTQHSESLDDVIMAHNQFIDTALFRCLLSKKARPVMNLIYELLSSILSFSLHVCSLCSGGDNHCSWENSYQTMARTYKSFRDTVRLLISVLSKLIARGYQPHLEELALRLNFNSFY